MKNIYQDSNDNISSKSESKWLNIKLLLKKKLILENSINEIKLKIQEQLSSKLREIYKEKLMIQSLIEKNKNLISSWKNKENNNISWNNYNYNFNITKDLKDLYPGSVDDIIQFFFYFRENHSAMTRLIDFIPLGKRKSIANFLGHLFYDTFLCDNEKEDDIIYIILFLLKKEIDNLLSPLSNNFLQDSFLKYFLIELGNKFEIRNYFDVILNPLIKDIEDKNSFNYNLNIIHNSKMHYETNYEDNIFFKMDKQEIKFIDYKDYQKKNKSDLKQFKKRNSVVINYKKTNDSNGLNDNKSEFNMKKSFRVKDINEFLFEDLQIKDYMNTDFFLKINEKYFRALLLNEKNELMKNFYIRQIKILNSVEDKNIFNCKKCFKRIKHQKLISQLSIEQFNKTVETIKIFIDKLLTNFEKKEIIPYYIKIICKLIDIFIQKKFDKISSTKKDSLICQFLFGTLILPILENPDICNSIGDMIISINTRGILINIYDVLKHLIEGCLFSSNDNIYYPIFNTFIIKNYNRINKIIDNIINNITIPSEYYNTILSILDKKDNLNQISGYYFNNKENNFSDFIYNKSICFNSNYFLLFYNTILGHKDEILQKDKFIENIFMNITENLTFMKFNVGEYYIITKENHKNNLIIKENKNEDLNIYLGNKTNIYSKLKSAIKYVLENLKLIINFDKSIKTQKTFEIINNYLNYYFKPTLNVEKPPLSWYSHYIVNNLNLLNNKYKENDYQLLYNDIVSNLVNIINDYKSLNDYLSTNLIVKINSIEKLISNYKLQIEKIKNTELNIKSLIFIETNQIRICLMTGADYNKLIKSEKKLIDNNLFLMSLLDNCPHNKKMISGEKIKYNERKYHCNNIEDFAKKFGEYHEIISEKIMNNSSGLESYKSKELKDKIKLKAKNKLIDENIISTYSIKKILEAYMNIIKKKIENNNYFLSKDSKEDKKIIENKIINIIWNYILKLVCDSISKTEPLFFDNIFKIRCMTLQKIIKPENLKIPKEIFEKNFIMKISENLKIIDELRTPGEIIKQFGIFIESINSLFKFFMNIVSVEPDELLNTIICFIIYSNPERLIFKTNFCKFFLNENELIGNLGINIIQIESSLVFINKLEAKQIGISQQEFNKICSQVDFN